MKKHVPILMADIEIQSCYCKCNNKDIHIELALSNKAIHIELMLSNKAIHIE